MVRAGRLGNWLRCSGTHSWASAPQRVHVACGVECRLEGARETTSAVAVRGSLYCVQIPGMTVDEQLKALGLQHLFWLKIDAEGFDPLVIKGANATLANHRVEVLQFECVPQSCLRCSARRRPCLCGSCLRWVNLGVSHSLAKGSGSEGSGGAPGPVWVCCHRARAASSLAVWQPPCLSLSALAASVLRSIMKNLLLLWWACLLWRACQVPRIERMGRNPAYA